MKIGLQVPYFTWEGGPEKLAPTLADIARTAEDSGFDSIWVMDHYFQIPMVAPPDKDMLEAYTTLGYIAGQTSRVGLGTLITGVTYRNPGILAKQVTTLDVLSGGRAWLGIGAAWFEQEHVGLGVPFPPLKERFERLEEALQIVKQMWSEDNGPYEGKHYQLAETLCVPQPLTRPRPPILIGGGGERKTLRFVARYADACNIFGDPTIVPRKLEVLARHCDAEGRDYDEIEKTVLFPMSIAPDGSDAGNLIAMLRNFSDLGVQTVIGAVIGVEDTKRLEAIGKEVLPAVAEL